MEYITHHRFKGKTMKGDYLNLPYGTKLICINNILYYQNKPVCFTTSENAKRHFSRNDDNLGLERGALTYAIAFAKRNHTGFRFNEKERNLITEKYRHWLKSEVDYILFNDDFFHAEIDEINILARELKIKL